MSTERRNYMYAVTPGEYAETYSQWLIDSFVAAFVQETRKNAFDGMERTFGFGKLRNPEIGRRVYLVWLSYFRSKHYSESQVLQAMLDGNLPAHFSKIVDVLSMENRYAKQLKTDNEVSRIDWDECRLQRCQGINLNVTIHGLQSAKGREMNGVEGVTTDVKREDNRFAVRQLSHGAPALIKNDNLYVLQDKTMKY